MQNVKVVKVYSTRETGVAGLDLVAGGNMLPIPMQGLNQISIEITMVTAGAVDLLAQLQKSADGVTWEALQTKATALGVETLSTRSLKKVSAGGTKRFTYEMQFDGNYFRLASIIGTGAAGGDVVSMVLTTSYSEQ